MTYRSVDYSVKTESCGADLEVGKVGEVGEGGDQERREAMKESEQIMWS